MPVGQFDSTIFSPGFLPKVISRPLHVTLYAATVTPFAFTMNSRLPLIGLSPLMVTPVFCAAGNGKVCFLPIYSNVASLGAFCALYSKTPLPPWVGFMNNPLSRDPILLPSSCPSLSFTSKAMRQSIPSIICPPSG